MPICDECMQYYKKDTNKCKCFGYPGSCKIELVDGCIYIDKIRCKKVRIFNSYFCKIHIKTDEKYVDKINFK